MSPLLSSTIHRRNITDKKSKGRGITTTRLLRKPMRHYYSDTIGSIWRRSSKMVKVVSSRYRSMCECIFATKIEAMPEEVIETYGYRFSIEEMFKDMKEVCGLEEQEVRKLDSCVGAYWLCLLSYVFIESWSLESGATLQNEHHRGPWDRSGRRISHAEKRKLFHQLVFREEFLQLLPDNLNSEILKILENPLFLSP
ncbi:MAG: transposase [Thermoguttaceae bacterium]